MTVYDPMPVTYHHADRSSWPEPPLDPGWDQLTKWRWQAGCVKARSGITIRFSDASTATGPGYHYQWPNLIGLLVEGTSFSVHADRVWDAVNNIEVGASAANRLHAKANQ